MRFRSNSEMSMFSNAEILIIEDNLYVSLDLASAIEELGGQVIGPVDTVGDALELIEHGSIAAAVVDCELRDRDSGPVVHELVARRLPFVIHCSTPLLSVTDVVPTDTPVLIKPLSPQAVVTCLLNEMRKFRPN
jgi:DNA-binding response OmpR family regulator